MFFFVLKHFFKYKKTKIMPIYLPTHLKTFTFSAISWREQVTFDDMIMMSLCTN